jgi:hypothetical protein
MNGVAADPARMDPYRHAVLVPPLVDREPIEHRERPALIQRDIAVDGYVAQREAALLDAFADHRGPAGLAVEGTDPTLCALAEDRVATLFVSADDASHARGWFAPPPDRMALNLAEVAERHQVLRDGPLADVAVRAALLGGASVHVLTPAASAQLTDGIGALCRYRA